MPKSSHVLIGIDRNGVVKIAQLSAATRAGVKAEGEKLIDTHSNVEQVIVVAVEDVVGKSPQAKKKDAAIKKMFENPTGIVVNRSRVNERPRQNRR